MFTLLWALSLGCSDRTEHPAVREGASERDPHEPFGDSGGSDSGEPDSGERDTEAPDTGTLDTGADTDDTPAEPAGSTVCYPGADETYEACVDLVLWSEAWGADYDYPDPYEGNPQYSEPDRFIDLDDADAELSVAPNFVLGEFMQSWKGRYGLYQVHMVERLQAIRDATGGPLNINSGYRNISYNTSVGGVTYSRHVYGDAVDMYSSVIGLTELGERCEDDGASYVGLYSSHVHCDWRDEALDEAFYDARRARPRDAALPEHSARIEPTGDAFAAPATGFDEGAPLRVWTARDGRGTVLAHEESERFTPPPGTHTVEVVVGGQVRVRRAVH